MKKLTSDNPQQQVRLDDAYKLAQTWRTTVAEREIQLMSKPETQEEARKLEGSGAGKGSMDAFRAKILEFEAAERGLLDERNVAAQEGHFVLLSGHRRWGGHFRPSSSAFVGWLLTSVDRQDDRPHDERNGRALSGGDTKTDIPAQGRRDEIGEMAKAVQVFKTTCIEA